MSSRRPRPADQGTPGSEQTLRAELRRSPHPCVLTGGQTGVDIAAALAGLRAGLPVHLVFPLGYRQEGGPLPSDLRRALHGACLHELTSPEFRYRTWTCAYLSDAVILIDPAGGDGCQETIRAAARLARPLLDLTAGLQLLQPERPVSRLARPERITAWLERTRPSILMVAGCRASVLADHGAGVGLDRQLDALLAVISATFAERLSPPAVHPSRR